MKVRLTPAVLLEVLLHPFALQSAFAVSAFQRVCSPNQSARLLSLSPANDCTFSSGPAGIGPA